MGINEFFLQKVYFPLYSEKESEIKLNLQAEIYIFIKTKSLRTREKWQIYMDFLIIIL